MSQTLTSAYKSTLIEKLLGKNYKWWYFIIFNFKAQRAYLLDTLMWAAFGITSILGTFFIWWLTTKDSQTFDTATIITYLFMGNVIVGFVGNWVEIDLGWMNIRGSITSSLLVPSSFMQMMYFRYVGRSILANFPLGAIGYLLLLPIISRYLVGPASIWAVVYIILLLPIAYTIIFFLNFSFGCITFWMTETEGAVNFYQYFRNLLSGALVPLFLFISFIPGIIYQPLAWIIYHPMQIYLGKYNFQETILVFAGGIAWCIILYFLAKFVFKAGLKRNEAVGL